MNGFLQFPKDHELLQQNGQQNGQHFNNFPSTSSTPFPDVHNNSQMTRPPHQAQNQPMFNPMNPAQWAAAAQNGGFPQQPQLNQWNTQSQFMNGMNAMMNGMPNMPMNLPFNMSLFSNQMFHDAFALSSPVNGADDERLLIDTLVDARTRRDNYKNALNSLHGRSGHSASLWKDFYLEHRDRIDAHVSLTMKNKGLSDPQHIVKVAKKPAIESFKPETSSPPSSSPASITKPRGRPSKATLTKPTKPTASGSSTRPITSGPSTLHSASARKRSTINSLTVHTASYNSRLPPPNTEIKIPPTPSRSPTPPTKVIPHSKGYKFTDEDQEFFIKFIQWRLKCDPSLSRNTLCEELAAKTAHHTYASWYAFWSNHHDLPDKILARAQGEVEEDDSTEEESSDDERPKTRPQPKYKLDSSDDEPLTEEESTDEEGAASVAAKLSFDESQMGLRGGPFTDADLALVARHVASFEDFASTPFSNKWNPWAERYPARSAKAWSEYYRRKEREINALAKKIKKAGKAKALSPRRDISESARDQVHGPPKAKRKFAPDEQEESENGNRAKMGKVE